MWTPHWITVSCHGVEGPMTSGYYCAIFPFCGGGKKKDDKKTKAFYDCATTGIPVKISASPSYTKTIPAWVFCFWRAQRESSQSYSTSTVAVLASRPGILRSLMFTSCQGHCVSDYWGSYWRSLDLYRFLIRNWLAQMTNTNRIISSQALIIIRSKRNTFLICNQNKRKSGLYLVAKLKNFNVKLLLRRVVTTVSLYKLADSPGKRI